MRFYKVLLIFLSVLLSTTSARYVFADEHKPENVTESFLLLTSTKDSFNNLPANIEIQSDLSAPLISQKDLLLLIYRFIHSYEDGDLIQFISLLDQNALTEDRTGKTEIKVEYKSLFDNTNARRFTLGNIDWQLNGNKATGIGYFEVQIWPQEKNELPRTFKGELILSGYKKKTRELIITELYHKY